MADPPFDKGLLPKGQVIQRLESLRCFKIDQESLPEEERIPGSALWEAPTGERFWISYSDCDAEYLEGIVAQIEKWIEEARHKKD